MASTVFEEYNETIQKAENFEAQIKKYEDEVEDEEGLAQAPHNRQPMLTAGDLQASCCTEQAMVERRVQTLNDTTVANDTTGVVVGSNGSPAASPDDGTSPVSFVFEDDQHNSRTLKALDMMRRNKHFCDLILHVGSTEFHAHRAVLGSVSPHLFEIFTAEEEKQSSKQSSAQRVTLTYKLNSGLDKHAIEHLIDYAYTSRLELIGAEVKSVYLAATHLKMDRVVRQCAQHLLSSITVANSIETRSLPGIERDTELVKQIDAFIASNFPEVSASKVLLSLPCIRIEVLNKTRQEMSLVAGESLCLLVLDWVRRQYNDEITQFNQLTEKTHLLYLAMDNSLQDCTELPTGDVSDTELVQDYKKLSLKNHTNSKNRRKGQIQPAQPRVLIYSQESSDTKSEDDDWKLIAANKVGEHSFLGLITAGGCLATLSVMLRLNAPWTPTPVTSPPPSRSLSEEKPALYCVMPHMSSVKCAVGCANLNGALLVCGGYDRGECLKIVESYNPSLNSWAELTPMKEPRGRFDVAVVKGKVYAVGGSNGTTELSTVEMYDPETGKWSRISSLPLARCNTGVCDLNEKIYCVGGWNGQVGIKQCDVFDPEIGKWESVAPLQIGRYQAGVCAMDGLVFAVGGCDAWNCLNSVEIYDPSTNDWSYSKNMITARRGCGLAVFNGKLYAVGGSDGAHSLNSTEIYDPTTQNWTPGPSLTTSRANVGVAVIGNRLYAVGGFSGKNFLNSIEYLDDKTNEWTTFVPRMISTDEDPTVITASKQSVIDLQHSSSDQELSQVLATASSSSNSEDDEPAHSLAS